MSPLLFAFQAARKSGVLLRGAAAALSALPRVSPGRARAGWPGRRGAAVAARRRARTVGYSTGTIPPGAVRERGMWWGAALNGMRHVQGAPGG